MSSRQPDVDATNAWPTPVASLHAFGILPTVNGQC